SAEAGRRWTSDQAGRSDLEAATRGKAAEQSGSAPRRSAATERPGSAPECPGPVDLGPGSAAERSGAVECSRTAGIFAAAPGDSRPGADTTERPRPAGRIGAVPGRTDLGFGGDSSGFFSGAAERSRAAGRLRAPAEQQCGDRGAGKLLGVGHPVARPPGEAQRREPLMAAI